MQTEFKTSEAKRAYSKAYYDSHKAQYLKHSNRWWKEHPEKAREKWTRAYWRKRDKKRASQKVRRLKRVEHYRKVNREWQSRVWAHRQKYMREYYLRNKDKIKNKVKKCYKENKARWWNYAQKRRALESVSAAVMAAIQQFVESVKRKRFAYCYWCGGKIPTSQIHFDHITPLAKGGQHSVENLCVSCAPCNLSKNDKFISRWNKLPQLFLEL